MDGVPKDVAAEALKLAEQLGQITAGKKLENEFFGTPSNDPHDMSPYLWQADFHNAGAIFPERGMVCANQIGKTRSCSAETSVHLTGIYPKWWKGKRFNRPVRWRVCSETNEASRDLAQKALLGEPGALGTGWLPLKSLAPEGPKNRQCGISDVVDYIRIKHASGGYSILQFKTYEQGVAKHRGDEIDGGWCDEEPPGDIYAELQTRVFTREGIIMVSFTPHLGHTKIYLHFTESEDKNVYLCSATWDDAPHLSEEQKADILSRYEPHERDTRSKGIAMMGEGAIFTFPDEMIQCDIPDIPAHWRRIAGIDFGFRHKQATSWIAHDDEADVVYVYDTYCDVRKDAVHHAAAINARPKWIPVAWPHDGLQHEKGGGEELASIYRTNSVNMMARSARYKDETGGGQPTGPMILEIMQRALTGRFKVSRHLRDWFTEKRFYHRKDGKIVRFRDDLLSSTFYAMMELRNAVSEGQAHMTRQTETTLEEYDPLGSFR